MLFLKTFKHAKFAVDGNAFQTFTSMHHYECVALCKDISLANDRCLRDYDLVVAHYCIIAV